MRVRIALSARRLGYYASASLFHCIHFRSVVLRFLLVEAGEKRRTRLQKELAPARLEKEVGLKVRQGVSCCLLFPSIIFCQTLAEIHLV